MVFNPKTTAEKQIIECELSIIPTENYLEKRSYIEVYDENGNKLKAQTVKEASNISIDWRKKVVFETSRRNVDYALYGKNGGVAREKISRSYGRYCF